MSIALAPIVNGYHSADSNHADLATVGQTHVAGAPSTVDTQGLNRIPAASLQFIYALSGLAVCGVFLTLAGWVCFEFLASLQTELQSLSTMQMLHALAGV